MGGWVYPVALVPFQSHISLLLLHMPHDIFACTSHIPFMIGYVTLTVSYWGTLDICWGVQRRQPFFSMGPVGLAVRLVAFKR